MNPYQNYSYQPNYQQPNYMQRGYASQPPQMPQFQQMAQTPMTIPANQQTPQIQEIRYGTEEEAKAYIVFPNCIAYFIDYPQNRLYAKAANPSGISNMEYFSLIPINADGSPIKPQKPTPQVNYDEFVKVEQLKDFGFVTIEQYNALAQKLDQMQKKLEGVKPNGTATKPETRV